MVYTSTQERDDAVAAAIETGDWSGLDKAVDDPLLGRILVRYRDGRWSAFRSDSGSPGQDGAIIQSFGVADDDGVLWFGTGDAEQSPRDRQVHGAEVLASFDGEIVRRYPAVTDVEDLTIDAEGRLWVVGGSGLYVITPEAVAGTE